MIKSIFGGDTSFYNKERKRVTEIIRLPLLEYVLQYLPHLQLTQKLQDDLWEMIAIKLNTHQFKTSLQHSLGETMEELPTLNGIFIKEIFETIMEKFVNNISVVNSSKRIYYNGLFESSGNNSAIQYVAFRLPVIHAYDTKEDQLCCELFYMKNLEVEVKAKRARDSFIDQVTNHDLVDSSKQLHDVKSNLENEKLEVCLQELKKKDLRIEYLNEENKRLMELNQQLLEEMKGRGS